MIFPKRLASKKSNHRAQRLIHFQTKKENNMRKITWKKTTCFKIALIVAAMFTGLAMAAETKQSAPELSTRSESAAAAINYTMIQETNRKYINDCFWAGPKGLDYGRVPGADPIQVPLLFPDQGSTYFVAQFKFPKGVKKLTIKGEYPHARYFSFTVANELPGGGLGNGPNLRDTEIHPDEGSVNPFRRTRKRNAPNREYTIQLVVGEPPAKREKLKHPKSLRQNILYVSPEQAKNYLHFALRTYIPDLGYDGTGSAKLGQKKAYGLPRVSFVDKKGRLIGNEKNSLKTPETLCKLLRTTRKNESIEYSANLWQSLVWESDDPKTAPAQNPPVWELFWNADYSVTGMFAKNQRDRILKYPPAAIGGFANNPDTKYLSSPFSLRYGEVYTIQGKMPSHPKTKLHNEHWPKKKPDVRYFSVCTGGSPPSGAGWNCVWDEAIPVDKDGFYTIVVSRPSSRPDNARPECGMKWLNFGDGEGTFANAQRSRPDLSILYIRYMVTSKKWKQSPANIPMPTLKNPKPQDAKVMGDYFPVSKAYKDRKTFEKHGCKPPRRPRSRL